jgi:YgiT-type zinc finger domain-containing protein
MKCISCKEGQTEPRKVTVTMKRGNTLVIVRDAPASVCQNCGEYSLDKSGADKLYRQGAEALR